MGFLVLVSSTAVMVLPGPHHLAVIPNRLSAMSLPILSSPGLLMVSVVEFLTYFLIIFLTSSLILFFAGTNQGLGRARRCFLNTGLFIIFGTLVIATNLTAYSFIHNVESKDAGVFLYMGQQILQGKQPYHDIWDHKPPLVFFINALGLDLGNGSAWGVWALEVAALCLAGWLLFRLIRRNAGMSAALGGIFLWLFGLFLLFKSDETNVPEAWGILFQSLLLVVIDHTGDGKNKDWGFFLAGLLTGVCFLLKQVMVGIGLSYLILTLVIGWRNRQLIAWLQGALRFALGAGLVVSITLAYFWVIGALPDLYDAAWLYNFTYIRPLFASIIRGWVVNLSNVLVPVAALAYLGWFVLLFRVLTRHKPQLPLIFRLVLVAFPLEILFSTLSGMNFPYYSLSRLYGIAIFGGALAGIVFSALQTIQEASRPAGAWLKWFAFSGTVVFSLLFLLYGYDLPAEVKGNTSRNTHVLTMEYIREHTSPGDMVLVWGNEAAINFYTARQSPTRFVYQYPLFNCAYLDLKKADGFYNDLVQKQPKLVIDTFDPLMPPLETSDVSKWKGQEGPSCRSYALLGKSLDHIHAHYRLTETILRWKVYALVR